MAAEIRIACMALISLRQCKDHGPEIRAEPPLRGNSSAQRMSAPKRVKLYLPERKYRMHGAFTATPTDSGGSQCNFSISDSCAKAHKLQIENIAT